MDAKSKVSVTPSPRLDGRTRVLLAAESLFASGGIDGVSLRQIATQAGQANHNAVQYHFGSREGLAQAIFAFRMQQMEPVRASMLARAQQGGHLGDLHALIEMIFLPQLEVLDTEEIHNYAGFLSQFLQRSHGRRFGDFGGPLPPNLTRVFVLLRQALESLPEAVAQRRLITACFMFLNILVSFGAGRNAEISKESITNALEDTLDQIVCSLQMPYRVRPIKAISELGRR